MTFIQLVLALLGFTFQLFFNNFVWLKITDELSVPEMGVWFMLLIKPDLKWCIYLSTQENVQCTFTVYVKHAFNVRHKTYVKRMDQAPYV